MTRHDKLVGLMISGKLPMPSYYTKSDEDLTLCAHMFERTAKQYIKTVEQRRMICFVQGVSRSGMTRRMTFKACIWHKGIDTYSYVNMNWFIHAATGATGATGIRINKDRELVVEGCGMDMVFNTNYTVIHSLQRLGYLKPKRAERLAQMTPTAVY
jgi:hypothetical protein